MKLLLLIPWLPPGFLFILFSLGEAQEQTPKTGWTTAFSLESEHDPTNLQDLKKKIKTPIDCVSAWSTAYSHREERKITKDNLLATIPLLKKAWKVSFDFKANKFGGQLLHMTVGEKGTGSGAKYGDRTPALWVNPSKGFFISSAVNGKPSFTKNIKALPSTGEWINIEVGQQLEGSKMIYSIFIGGKKVFSSRNWKPAEFENVQVFASSRWYFPVRGFIKNLLIQNKNDGRSILTLNFIFIMLSLKILKANAYSIGHPHSPFRESSY